MSRFADWCRTKGLTELVDLEPVQVAAYVEQLGKRHEMPCLDADRAEYIEAADIRTQIGNHTFRATGISEYLRNGGKLEFAQRMANQASARTTGLDDRRDDQVSLGVVERILISQSGGAPIRRGHCQGDRSP